MLLIVECQLPYIAASVPFESITRFVPSGKVIPSRASSEARSTDIVPLGNNTCAFIVVVNKPIDLGT